MDPDVVRPAQQQPAPDMALTNEVICTSTAVCEQSLAAVLASVRPHQLHVPLFQRRYCWGAEQWAKFETDISAAASAGRTLFIGRVLTFVGPVSPHTLVCDGQQRLVTLTLLLAAIRDVALADDVRAPELAEEIDGLLFLDGARKELALVPTHDDRAAYAAALARPGEAPPMVGAAADGNAHASAAAAPDSISEGKRVLTERVRAWLERQHHTAPASPEATTAWRDRLAVLSACAREKVLLVIFKLDQGEEVHRVFAAHAQREKALKSVWNFTMPGMQVSPCDLIRNQIVAYVTDETEQARLHARYWLPMERAATGGSGKELEPFFMAFLHVVGFSVGIRPELYAGFRAWLADGVLADVPLDDRAAVRDAIEGALQALLAEALKWEVHVHKRVPVA